MMSDVVIVAIVAAVPVTIAAILSAWVGLANRSKLGQVETRMDGRLDELLEITRTSSFAAGKKEARGENDSRNGK
jgi:hypothetical protein